MTPQFGEHLTITIFEMPLTVFINSRFLSTQRYDVDAAFEEFHHFQSWRRAHKIRKFHDELNVDA